MNAHRTLGLLAAVLVTTGQAMVFAVDTAAVAQNAGERDGYASSVDTTIIPGARVVYGEPDGRAARN